MTEIKAKMEVMPMPNRSLHHVTLMLCTALAGAAVGCGGTTASEPVASASSAATRGPIAQNTHGPVRLFGDALSDVPLTPSQRGEIEQLAADAEGRHAGARSARRELMLAIAAQVEAGSIDRVALQPKLGALAAAMSASQPADRTAFERLHALLGPDQRTLFVDALEARAHERVGGMRSTHPLKQWADDLKLSDEQRSQIKSALEQHVHSGGEHGDAARWMDGRRHGAKLLDAFKQDRFALEEVAPRQNVGELTAKTSDHFLSLAEAALPVLTPAQRAIAAQKLRARAEETENAESLTP